jgi:8-oxo-dGTP pyrophosphatase MutT (NUDIX family)
MTTFALHATMPPPPFLSLPPHTQRAFIAQCLAAPAPDGVLGQSDGHRLPGREGALRPAAVLLPLVERPEGTTLLLTERSPDLSDHPGQISFPGGRIETSDASAAAAALREAFEETGLPGECVTLLGELPHYTTVTGYDITPVAGWVQPPFTLKLDPFEVSDVFEVPLAFVLDPDNQKREFRMSGTTRRDYWAIPFGDRYIWGATASMLVMFSSVLRHGT